MYSVYYLFYIYLFLLKNFLNLFTKKMWCYKFDWEELSLDFITGLPSSQGNTVILVIVDRFSKGDHFGVLPTHFPTFKVVQLLLDLVCKQHGFPHSLVSDRDLFFISKFWRELFKLCCTKLRMSTSYHPDGQNEVLNFGCC